MPVFNNTNELLKYLQLQIAASLKETGEYVENKVKEQIDQDVYSYTPSRYQRTGDLKESVVCREPINTGNKTSIVIEHDTHLINDHVSQADGMDVSPYIPYYVNEGAGPLFGEGFWTQKRQYIDHAISDLRSTGSHVEVLRRSLKNKGIVTK